MFGGAALAIVVVAAGTEGRSLGRLVADAALIALAANLANLLDRGPGRVTKAAGAAFAVLAVATRIRRRARRTGAGRRGRARPPGAGPARAVMLGDAGANPLGAAVGVGVVLACSPGVRVAALVAVGALNLASELVSFTKVIDRTPPLRFLDRLGRST